MQTYQLTVGQDGRVAIPDTRPGQSVVVLVQPEPDTVAKLGTYSGPIPEEEHEAILSEVKRLAREIHAGMSEPWRSMDHGDLLYDENGLPK